MTHAASSPISPSSAALSTKATSRGFFPGARVTARDGGAACIVVSKRWRLFHPTPAAAVAWNSVLRGDRATEAVIHTHGSHVDVLADCVAARHRNGGHWKRHGVVTHEEMIVFGGDRPVRRKAEFNPGPHGAAPTRFARLNEHDVGRGEERAVAVIRDRSAALHVPENVVPGIADLAGEQADGVDLGLIGVGNDRRQTAIGSLQTGPIALSFDAEHPAGGLPTITDLTAGQTAGRVVAALGIRENRCA